MTLSILVITHNSERLITDMLESIRNIYDEFLAGDYKSTDSTIDIVKKYGGKVISFKKEHYGMRKQTLVSKAKGDWILILDTDERVSKKLKKEILQTLSDKGPAKNISGYSIPYQNHIFGKAVVHGGESYRKVRLFKRGYGYIDQSPIHEEIHTKGKTTDLYGVIYHFSYRSIAQVIGKFTHYAYLSAQEKYKNKEPVTLKKLFLYGPNMFRSRYIKDKGYLDGLHGLFLASAFMYLEALTYWSLFFKNLKFIL